MFTAGFHPLTVKGVVPETAEASSIVFDIPADATASFNYVAGQFLTIQLEIAGQSIVRCYSMSSAPGAAEPFQITVKRVVGGIASNWMLDNLRQGDIVSARPPRGQFILGQEMRPLLMFAGGSGITPIFALIKSALAKGWPKIRLFYASSSPESEIFSASLTAIAHQYPSRLEILRHYDSIDGYPTSSALKNFIDDNLDSIAYLCGPSSFMAAVEGALKAVGVQADRIHAEYFASLTLPETAALAPDGQFVLECKEGVYGVPYHADESMLSAALALKLPIAFSCAQGHCGACIVKVLEGDVRMPPNDLLTEEERNEGLVLLCQARATESNCRVKAI